MPFPTDDRAWNDTLLFLLERRRPGERTLAPDQFVDELPFVRTYGQPKGEDEPADAWTVIHKGMLDRLEAPFLQELGESDTPVFANEVFVVFARNPGAEAENLSESAHVRALFGLLGALSTADKPEAPAAVAEEAVVEPPLAPAPEPVPVAPPAPAAVAPAAAAPAAAPRGRAGLRLRQQEMLRLLAEYLGDVSRRRVVDLGCGLGRFRDVLASAEVLGIDAAPDLIEDARRAHADLPNFRFLATDPRKPALKEEPFEITLLADVLGKPGDDATALLESAAALTAPGGLLFVSVENSAALHHRVAQEVPAAGFTFAELAGAVQAAGFRVVRADGAVLPWPTGPGSEDDAVVAALCELGQLAGPSYAQTIVLLARKG